MFSRFVALLPLAGLAVVGATGSTCNSGSVYCCDQTFSNPSNFSGNLLPGILGILLGLGVNAGITCTPITVIGALSDGAKCTQQTACCENVYQNGLVNIACTPIAVPV